MDAGRFLPDSRHIIRIASASFLIAFAFLNRCPQIRNLGFMHMLQLFETGINMRLTFKLLAHVHKIVGEQTSFRVSHSCLDQRGLARLLRLARKRTQLTSDLFSQVQNTHEILIHVSELLQRTLFTPAMLQHTGRLFNEPATIFRGCLKDRV